MLKIIIVCTITWGLTLYDVSARPEGMDDIKLGAMMVVGSMKEAFENGGKIGDEKEIEVLGFKAKHGVSAGFGDAMKPQQASSEERRKRSASIEMIADKMRTKRSNSEQSPPPSLLISPTKSSSSPESEETERRKRSASFEKPISNSSKFYDDMRAKRSNSNESGSSSSMSSSEYSSSSESDSKSDSELMEEDLEGLEMEPERRKRSASFEILTNEIMNLHNANMDTTKVKRSVFDHVSSSSFGYLERARRSASAEKLPYTMVLSDPLPANASSSSDEEL